MERKDIIRRWIERYIAAPAAQLTDDDKEGLKLAQSRVAVGEDAWSKEMNRRVFGA